MIRIPSRIPIHIHPIFWLMAGLLSLLGSGGSPLEAFLWLIVIIVSLLVHEMGHALTATFFGQRATVELMGYGGLTLREGGRLSLPKEFLIVVNGPAAGFVLFVLSSYVLLKFPSLPLALTYAFQVSVSVNFFWTLVNLLPVVPLDGGRLVGIILEGVFGFKGMRYSYLSSFIFSVGFAICFLLLQQIVPGVLFTLFAFESFKMWREFGVVSPADLEPRMQQLLGEARRDFMEGSKELARHKLSKIREETKRGVIFVKATEDLARIAYQEGREEASYELLHPVQKYLSIQGLVLLQKTALALHFWQEAADVGKRVHEATPSAETAVNNAMAHAQMGQELPAVGWLQCAVNEGLGDIAKTLARKEFDPVRLSPAFQKFLSNSSL